MIEQNQEKFCQNCCKSYSMADMVRLKRGSVTVLRCKHCVARRNPAIEARRLAECKPVS